MKRIILLASLLSLALLTSACQTYYGEGPVKFSNKAAGIFENYLGNRDSTRFAITENGSGAVYYYCPDGRTQCVKRPSDVINFCKETYHTQGCKHFAIYRNISWKNPGNFMPYHSDIVVRELGQSFFKSSKPNITNSALNQTPDNKTYTILVDWQGYDKKLKANINLPKGKSEGIVFITDIDIGLACEGTFKYAKIGTGEWSTVCGDNLTASGILIKSKQNDIWHGKGLDSNNQQISFLFIP